MNITEAKIFGPKVSLGIIGKPYFFRTPKYEGDDKDFSESNIDLLSQYLGKQIQILNQYHSSEVIVLDDNNKNSILSGDAIVSKLTDVAIFVLASDCVPIILYDGLSETIGVIHAGRKGLEEAIITKTVKIFTDKFQANIREIKIFIGPCISQKNYELGFDQIKSFKKGYFEYIKSSINIPGKYYLDIRNIAKKQLLDAGIERKNISISSECTYENSDKYHSYRRHTHFEEKSYGNNAFGIWIS